MKLRRLISALMTLGANRAAVLLLLLTWVGIAAWRLWLPPPGSGDIKSVPRLSIVVLPFANLSNEPDQDYFLEAITDDLTTDLSRIDGSVVIARTTAFTYKGKSVDVKRSGVTVACAACLKAASVGSAIRSRSMFS